MEPEFGERGERLFAEHIQDCPSQPALIQSTEHGVRRSQYSGSEIIDFGSGSSEKKSEISDPDPDPDPSVN